MGTITQVRFGAEWINNFHDDACKQANLVYRSVHANDFCKRMRDKGHMQIFNWGDDNVWETDFRHPDFGGDSLNQVDNVHFCFYSDHGGNWSNVMHIAFSKAHTNCLGSSTEWKLGAKMLKWLVLDCCQCVLNTTSEHIGAVWFPPAHGVHMIFGFIGNGHDGPNNSKVGDAFGVEAAQGNNLGNAWLAVAYSASYNDHPIVIAFGATENEATNRRDNENINWRDLDVKSPIWFAAKWRT